MRPHKIIRLSVAATVGLTGIAMAAPVAHGGQKFSMILTDEAEVPGPGDPAASGFANIIINPGQSRICWEITTSGVNPGYSIVAGTGAHIHRGSVTSSGPVVVPLSLTLNGTATGCTTVANRALIEEIRKYPERFYVNLHWADTTVPITLTSYAAGALRAQIGKNQLM